MEENKKVINRGNNDEKVRTLDGRIVSKREIKDGEIYINSEGKKFRKVVKKAVKPTAGVSATTSKPEPSQEKPEQPQEAPQAKEEQGGVSFMNRLNSKHSFLVRMQNNQSISTEDYGLGAVAAQQAMAEAQKAQVQKDGESSGPDAGVAQLEQAVVNEKKDKSSGKGGNVADGTFGSSSVGGAAYNPNGSVLNNPNSNADNAVSKGLAGSFSTRGLPQPLAKPVSTKKSRRHRKPIKLWIPITIMVAVYVVCCAFYFITNYNFTDKSVKVGMYYVNLGDNAKLEYYDGERFNFHEMLMTYYMGESNVNEYELSKYCMVAPTNSMGYSLKDGYIYAVWDNGYENEISRTVSVKFLYNQEVCFIPVTIYKNSLVGLSSYTSIPNLESAGQQFSATVFGVYSNIVMEREGIICKERKLQSDEFDIYMYVNGNKQVTPLKYHSGKDGEQGTYELPSNVDYHSSNKIVLKAVAKEKTTDGVYAECVLYDIYSVNANYGSEFVGVDSSEYPYYIKSRNVAGEVGGSDDVTEVKRNNKLEFTIVPNTAKGYTLRTDDFINPGQNNSVVTCKVGSGSTGNVYTLYPDELGNYTLDRTKITGDVTISVSNCTNKYRAYFLSNSNITENIGLLDTLKIDENNSVPFNGYLEYAYDEAIYKNDWVFEAVYGGNKYAVVGDRKSSGSEFDSWKEYVRLQEGEDPAGRNIVHIKVYDANTDSLVGYDFYESEIVTTAEGVQFGSHDRYYVPYYNQSYVDILTKAKGYKLIDKNGDEITSIIAGESIIFKPVAEEGYNLPENLTVVYHYVEGGVAKSSEIKQTSGYYSVKTPESGVGSIVIDVNVNYYVQVCDMIDLKNSFDNTIKQIQRYVGSLDAEEERYQQDVQVILKDGYAPIAGETLKLIICNEELENAFEAVCDHKVGANTYIFKIDRSKLKDNVKIFVSGIKKNFNIKQNTESGQYTIQNTLGQQIDSLEVKYLYAVDSSSFDGEVVDRCVDNTQDVQFVLVTAEGFRVKSDSQLDVYYKESGANRVLFLDGPVYSIPAQYFTNGINEFRVSPVIEEFKMITMESFGDNSSEFACQESAEIVRGTNFKVDITFTGAEPTEQTRVNVYYADSEAKTLLYGDVELVEEGENYSFVLVTEGCFANGVSELYIEVTNLQEVSE